MWPDSVEVSPEKQNVPVLDEVFWTLRRVLDEPEGSVEASAELVAALGALQEGEEGNEPRLELKPRGLKPYRTEKVAIKIVRRTTSRPIRLPEEDLL